MQSNKKFYKSIKEIHFLCEIIVAMGLFALALFCVFPVMYPGDMQGTYRVVLRSWMIITSGIVIAVQFKLIDKMTEQCISNYIVKCINYLYFIPGILINTIYASEVDFYFYFIVYWMVFNGLALSIKHPRKRPKRINNMRVSWVLLIGIAVSSIVISLIVNDFRFTFVNILDYDAVYSLRETNSLLKKSTLVNIFISFSSLVMPIGVVLACRKKKYIVVAILSLAVLAIYSIAGNRVYIFFLLIAYIDCYARDRKKVWIAVVITILGLSVIPTGVININGNLFSDIIRRVVLTPNIIARFYHDYFTTHAPDGLRQALDWYLQPMGIYSRYSTVIPIVVGEVYSYDGRSTFNTGLVGSAMSMYGYWGAIFSPFLYIMSIRLLEYLTNNSLVLACKFTFAIIVSITIMNTNYWAEALIIPSSVLVFYFVQVLFPQEGDIRREAAGTE